MFYTRHVNKKLDNFLRREPNTNSSCMLKFGYIRLRGASGNDPVLKKIEALFL